MIFEGLKLRFKIKVKECVNIFKIESLMTRCYDNVFEDLDVNIKWTIKVFNTILCFCLRPPI